MDTYTEKRLFKRLNMLTDVTYTKAKSPEGLAFARNIGMGGICLIVYEKLNAGDILELNVILPDDPQPIPTRGRVAWIKEFIVGDPAKGERYDAGIEFLDISKENKDRVNKYVFAHL